MRASGTVTRLGLDRWWLARILAAHDMSSKDLALAIGANPSTVCQYATGSIMPKTDTARDIAVVLGESLDEMLGIRPHCSTCTHHGNGMCYAHEVAVRIGQDEYCSRHEERGWL